MEVALTALSVQFSRSVVFNLCNPVDCTLSRGLDPLSITTSWSLLRLMLIESVMPSNHPVSSLSPPAFNLSQVDCSLPRTLTPNLEFFLPAAGGGGKNDYLSSV